ncbi:helix-turn-helix transcriptional regulator [Actinosynnema sp. NPDC023587]|uniref:helix-turn-helix transcriptional regulator n=1 Tax=Actinosynnema sp. NPDC023587 TaxID=3154695 RepID=UPI0033FE30DC
MAVRRTGFVRARKAAGFTQESFAEAMHVDRSTVARWEQGAREPLPYQRSKLARLLKTTMNELDGLLHPEVQSVAATQHASSHLEHAPVDQSVLLAAQTSNTPTQSVAIRETIAFRAVSEAFQVVDRKIGGGALYGQVVRFLQDEVAPKLLAPPSGVTHYEVFSAAASFSEFAGWTAHDSGRDRQAKVHLTQAYHLATTAQNLPLGCNVLASLSHLAVQMEDVESAERLAVKGISQVTDSQAPAPHLVARLHAMHARALAMRGGERAARLALEAGESALDAIVPDARNSWLSGFDRASFAAEVALCMYDLHRYEDAAQSAIKVITSRSAGDRVRSRILAGLTLANSLVALGDHAGAARVGIEIITAAPGLKSARVHSGLARLQRQLSTQATLSEVSEMNDRLAASAASAQSLAGQPEWPL